MKVFQTIDSSCKLQGGFTLHLVYVDTSAQHLWFDRDNRWIKQQQQSVTTREFRSKLHESNLKKLLGWFAHQLCYNIMQDGTQATPSIDRFQEWHRTSTIRGASCTSVSRSSIKSSARSVFPRFSYSTYSSELQPSRYVFSILYKIQITASSPQISPYRTLCIPFSKPTY